MEKEVLVSEYAARHGWKKNGSLITKSKLTEVYKVIITSRNWFHSPPSTYLYLTKKEADEKVERYKNNHDFSVAIYRIKMFVSFIITFSEAEMNLIYAKQIERAKSIAQLDLFAIRSHHLVDTLLDEYPLDITYVGNILNPIEPFDNEDIVF